MNSLYDSTKKFRARQQIESIFNNIIRQYEIQERGLINTFLQTLISEIAFEPGVVDFIEQIKKNFPQYLYYATQNGGNILAETSLGIRRYMMGYDDYNIGNIEDNNEAYGLIYENVIKEIWESVKGNTLEIGTSLLQQSLKDLNFEYNPEYKSLVQAVYNMDNQYLTIQHIGTDNRHGDFSLSIDGNIEGLVDIKSMKSSSLSDINKVYRNILKNVPIYNNQDSYKSYVQGLVDSFKYEKSKKYTNRQNSVLIFMFRDEAIWTSELLMRLKDDIINDWMDRYENGRLLFR